MSAIFIAYTLNVFWTFEVSAQSISIIEDHVTHRFAAGKIAVIDPSGDYAFSWDHSSQHNGTTEIEVIPNSADLSRAPFKLSASNPYEVRFMPGGSSNRAVELVTEKGAGTVLLVESASGVEKKRHALGKLNSIARIADVSQNAKVLIFTESELIAYSLNEETTKRVLTNVQFSDTVAVDRREDVALYFPNVSRGAGFVFSFKQDNQPYYFLPGLSAQSENKIVAVNDRVPPKLHARIQARVTLASLSLTEQIFAALVYRKSGPRIFVWREDLLVDLLPVPRDGLGNHLQVLEDHILLLSTSDVTNTSSCYVYKISTDERMAADVTPLTWKCKSAGYSPRLNAIFALDVDNQVHRLRFVHSKEVGTDQPAPPKNK